MGELATGDAITNAWVSALELLVARDGEAFDVLVTIEDPNPMRADERVIALPDQVLMRQHADAD